MDIIGILNRIDEQAKVLGLSDRSVSLNAGLSSDGIRNWKRRSDGRSGMNMKSLEKVARTLNVSLNWLLYGDDDQPTGFSDEVAYFNFMPQPGADPIASLFGATARNPAVTHRAQIALPDFAIASGDLLVCDLSRTPIAGEIAIATVLDIATGTSSTIIRRYLPPYLLAGNSGPTSDFVKIDPETMTLRHPIIGSIRGTADN